LDDRVVREPDHDGSPRLDQVLLARLQRTLLGSDQPGPVERRPDASSPPRNSVDQEDAARGGPEHEVAAADVGGLPLAPRARDGLPGARDHRRRPVGGVQVFDLTAFRPADDSRPAGRESEVVLWPRVLARSRGTPERDAGPRQDGEAAVRDGAIIPVDPGMWRYFRCAQGVTF